MRNLVSILFLMFFVLPSFGQPADNDFDNGYPDSLVYKDKSFRYMNSLDSLLRLTNHEADSLANSQTLQRNRKDGAFFSIGKWLDNIYIKIFFWAIIGIFILFVLYKLLGFNLLTSARVEELPTGTTEPEELRLPEWYDGQILTAEETGDFMVATRFHFLKTLSLLNDKRLIQFLPEKTNSAYADELKDEMLKERFQRLASFYEYVWYGVNRINADQYAIVRNFYLQTNELI